MWSTDCCKNNNSMCNRVNTRGCTFLDSHANFDTFVLLQALIVNT